MAPSLIVTVHNRKVNYLDKWTLPGNYTNIYTYVHKNSLSLLYSEDKQRHINELELFGCIGKVYYVRYTFSL